MTYYIYYVEEKPRSSSSVRLRNTKLDEETVDTPDTPTHDTYKIILY